MFRIEARINGGEWAFVGYAGSAAEAKGFANGYWQGFRDGGGQRIQVETKIYDVSKEADADADADDQEEPE